MSKATRCFIINKLGELVISLLIVTILSFLLVRLSPIDPAEAYARRSMAAFSFTDEQMEALREKMGLNDSLPVQYVKWVRDAFHLDFGKSFVSGQSVFEKVTTAIGITVTIVIISAIIQAIFILLIGCLCYLTRKRIIGRALIFLCIAGVSIPSFFFASTYIDIFVLHCFLLCWQTISKKRWNRIVLFMLVVVAYLRERFCSAMHSPAQ